MNMIQNTVFLIFWASIGILVCYLETQHEWITFTQLLTSLKKSLNFKIKIVFSEKEIMFTTNLYSSYVSFSFVLSVKRFLILEIYIFDTLDYCSFS